jgi:hypothetical protein
VVISTIIFTTKEKGNTTTKDFDTITLDEAAHMNDSLFFFIEPIPVAKKDDSSRRSHAIAAV